MVFHVLINRHITCLNHVWSCDVFDDQTLGGPCVVFPGSRAIRSHDMLGIGRSCDLSHDRSCNRFPQSHVLEITWLELGLGAVVNWLGIVEWVLGSFGNAFPVGMSFAHDSIPSLGSPCTCKACMHIPSLDRCWAWNSVINALAWVSSPTGIYELSASV